MRPVLCVTQSRGGELMVGMGMTGSGGGDRWSGPGSEAGPGPGRGSDGITRITQQFVTNSAYLPGVMN